MKRISSIVLVMLALATTQAGADDWGDCKQTKDEDLSIAGCTVIIESGTQSKTNLARAYYDRGVAHAQKGQHDLAIADYDRTIAINPKNADAYGNRGAIYNSKGQYDRAIADYDRAIALNPKYANMYGNRAIAYYYLKNCAVWAISQSKNYV